VNGRISGVLNTSKSGLWTPEEHLYDVNGIRTGVTPRYGSYFQGFDGIICGVQDTGMRSTDGAGLRHVTAASPLQATTLDTAYFDEHPLFNFPDWTDASGNVFCEIPIAYWWRGNLPDVVDGTTPRWTMLMSTAPGTVNIGGTECEFTASPGAFKRGGAWMDKFYFGKYRGHNAGSNKVGSKSGKTHWGNVSFENFKTYCSNNGTGYHMISLQEWHEILGRAVVEKKTFQLVPEASRQNASLCKYRGIEDFAFSGTTYVEWMDGARTDASGKYELWTEAGGDYSSTGVAAATGTSEATYYNQGLISGGLFDHLFLGASLGPASTSFIPDHSGRNSGVVGRICYSYFYSGYAYGGAFRSHFNNLPSDAHASIGSRLAKW
jgi:hypothetical protein